MTILKLKIEKEYNRVNEKESINEKNRERKIENQ
jgi:hypothetical protein